MEAYLCYFDFDIESFVINAYCVRFECLMYLKLLFVVGWVALGLNFPQLSVTFPGYADISLCCNCH